MSVLPTVGLICLAALSSILTSTCTAAELTVLLRFRPALVSFPNQDHGQGPISSPISLMPDLRKRASVIPSQGFLQS
jgi:hypothetical protein